MQKNKTYKLVGLFVLTGFLVFAAIIFHYVGKKFSTDDSQYVVLYFEESIQGLNVGSSVVFKGVEVGRVVKINLLTDLQTGTFKMPVFINFKEKKSFRIGKDKEISAQEILHSLIKKGLRARLISANYLTGQLMIELDMEPNTPAILRGTGDHLEIPTVISSIGMISKDLQEIPFRENMMQLGNLLKELDEKLPPIMENLYRITDKTDKIIEKKSTETTKTLTNFNAMIEQMTRAGRSIQNLSDYLERHPEAILQGKRRPQ
ncbi:MAG: MlaD family protein [Pseudomonadota bacterium]|nr:MlaD family protein [Pseudomonadota bacterium]